MAIVKLKKERLRRALRRHPWVYPDAIQELDGEVADGDVVEVVGPDGRFVAWAFFNRGSRLALRMFTTVRAEGDPRPLFVARLRAAIALRREVLGLEARGDAYRVCHSEGDGLPGLIVDRYGPVAVVACSSLGTYGLLDALIPVLVEELGVSTVFEVGAAKGLRGAEGLPPGRGVLVGAPLGPEGLIVTIDGLRQRVRVSGGQKTGLFLDQRDNAARFAALCKGESVLDACCYGGLFALSAARAGAAAIEAFDVSDKAVALATENAALNGLEGRVTLRRGELFTELRSLRDAGRQFGRVVLDPPSFAGRRKDLKKAQKAYVEAHKLAIALLSEGGVLASYTCSHHVSEKDLEDSLQEAGRRAGMSLQVLERQGAPGCHPQELYCPEGRYLKGLLVRRLG
jgi:23S rRNA (cytosine1962-C5)-methyltransferase